MESQLTETNGAQPFVGLIADVWWKMREFNATVLHLLFKSQGLAQELTRVVLAKIMPGLIA
jgi:hypothetical protein